MDAPRLSIFVYGTLKRGGRNHDRYCQGAVAIEPARALGRLHHLPQRYPMLDVPPQDVLALGSNDAATDARRQYESLAQSHKSLANEAEAATDCSLAGEPIADARNWLLVRGELIAFDDPAPRLLALDRLEAYAPSEQAGEYWRVLIRLVEPAGALAWTYVAPNGQLPPGAMPCGDEWP